MAPGRSYEVIELADSDDEVAADTRKSRSKASKPAKSNTIDTIDLTGEDLSDTPNQAFSTKSKAAPTVAGKRLLTKVRSFFDHGPIAKTDGESVPAKKIPPVVPSSDSEDELPDDPTPRSRSARKQTGNKGHSTPLSSSMNPSKTSSPRKRHVRETLDSDHDSLHAEKRRRVITSDDDDPPPLLEPTSSRGTSKNADRQRKQTLSLDPSRSSRNNSLERRNGRTRKDHDTGSNGRLPGDSFTKPAARSTPTKPPTKRIRDDTFKTDLQPKSRGNRNLHDGLETSEPRNEDMSSCPHVGVGDELAENRGASQPGPTPTGKALSAFKPRQMKAKSDKSASAGASPSSQLREEAAGAVAKKPPFRAQSPPNCTKAKDGQDVDPRQDAVSTASATGHVTPDLSSLTLPQQVERVIGKYMQEMREDTDYFTKAHLKRSRQSIEMHRQHQSARLQKGRRPGQTSVASATFARRRGLNAERDSTDTSKASKDSMQFNIEVYKGNRANRSRVMVEPTNCNVCPLDKDVPGYAHYVSLRSNILAPNTTTMNVWPYFGDDAPNPNDLESYYHMDTKERRRKIRRLLQAQKAEEYVESAVRDLQITWEDILRFLLDLNPEVGSLAAAKNALINRKHHLEDFPLVKDSKKWTIVLSSLRAPHKDRLAKAALFCDNFQRMAGFPLWHIARRSQVVQQALEAQDSPPSPLDSRTCRICLKFNCNQHGELQEYDSDSDSGIEADEAVATDILYPLKVNFRKRMSFPQSPPQSVDEAAIKAANAIVKQKKTPAYWDKSNFSKAGECGPFYPCHHPGQSCAKANCSCVLNRTPCEKSCGCSVDCPRKFQGCSCSAARHRKSGDYVCMRDERCACYQMGRECDPDLCGSCGVCEVLDPVHRHDNMRTKCHNASIQKGVPKHTLLGDSGVHGMGLYAGQLIKEHEFIGEYKGEVITREEGNRRGAVYEYQDNSYLFSLNTEQEVDSTLYGNKIRFINHRNRHGANVYPLIRLVNTVHRIGLFANDDIKAGEELFFDYGPKFPEHQLGGKQQATSKSTPHVRNTKVVRQFYDVEDDEDEFGNRRARKAPAHGTARSRPRKADSEGKSLPLQPKKQKGGARPGAGRKPGKKKLQEAKKLADAGKPVENDDDRDKFISPQERLTAYNISQDTDGELNGGEDGDDADFNPGGQDGEGTAEESSEDDEDDEDEDGGRPQRRSGRPRRFEL